MGERPLVALIGEAARAGVDLIQIREPDLDDRALVTLARAAVAAVRGTPARVIVNDRADVALAAGAAGVHLRGDSMPGRARARDDGPGLPRRTLRARRRRRRPPSMPRARAIT